MLLVEGAAGFLLLKSPITFAVNSKREVWKLAGKVSLSFPNKHLNGSSPDIPHLLGLPANINMYNHGAFNKYMQKAEKISASVSKQTAKSYKIKL